MSQQIEGYVILRVVKKRPKSDPLTTKFVMELSNSDSRHRTCFDSEFKVVSDKVLWALMSANDDITDYQFDIEV